MDCKPGACGTPSPGINSIPPTTETLTPGPKSKTGTLSISVVGFVALPPDTESDCCTNQITPITHFNYCIPYLVCKNLVLVGV